jgi:hypothetical protein
LIGKFVLLGGARKDPEHRVGKKDQMSAEAGEGVKDHGHIWVNEIGNWKLKVRAESACLEVEQNCNVADVDLPTPWQLLLSGLSPCNRIK